MMIEILKMFLINQKIKIFILMVKIKHQIFKIINIKQNFKLSSFDMKINIPSKKKLLKTLNFQ